MFLEGKIFIRKKALFFRGSKEKDSFNFIYAAFIPDASIGVFRHKYITVKIPMLLAEAIPYIDRIPSMLCCIPHRFPARNLRLHTIALFLLQPVIFRYSYHGVYQSLPLMNHSGHLTAQKKLSKPFILYNFGEFICYINLVSLKSAGTISQDRSCLFLRQ